MTTQILKELLQVYSEIPIGMLVFKERNLFFINKHLKETLMLDNVDTKESINIICSILKIDTNQTELYNFFQNNEFLSYKDKHIQISSKSVSEYFIFMFIKIDKSLLETIKESLEIPFIPIVSENTEIITNNQENHKKLLEYFDKKGRQKVRGYTLYKGVPLISDNIIQQEHKNTLVIKIEDKQMIAAEKGKAWIFVTSSGVAIEGTIVFLNREKRLIFLNNLNKIEKGFHLRETIRYQDERPINLIIKSTPIEIELQIVDINESAFKVTTNNYVILEKLVAQNTQILSNVMLNDKTITFKSKYLFEAGRREGESVIVMEYSCNETEYAILKNWFNERQIEIIKEVKKFSDKL
jgi:hypothetical protein